MSIFRENYRLEVEARYKETVQERLQNILAMNEANPSFFTRGALGVVFGGGVRESIAQLKEEMVTAISPLHVATIGSLAAVDRDVRSNARRSFSQDDVNEELGEVWGDLQEQVQNLSAENIASFLTPDKDLQRIRHARDQSILDAEGEVKGGYDDRSGRFSRFPSPPSR